MALIRDGRLVQDEWRDLDDDAPLPQPGDVIVSLARWRRDATALLDHQGRLGVRLESDQLADTLYKAWGPGVLTNTRSNITPIDTLASEMLGYDWFYPTIQNIESRSIASQQDDPNTYIDDHFGEMTIPVLYFGSGGFGAESLLSGIHSAARSGSDDVTIKVLEDYGHLDVLFASDAPEEVYGVIYEWIMLHQTPGLEFE